MAIISVGQIIDRSWQHYSKHFIELMSITVWLLIIAVINVITTWISPDPTTIALNGNLTKLETFATILYGINLFILTPIVSIWIFNTLVLTIDKQTTGKSVNMQEVSKEGLRFFWPRILVGLMVIGILLSTLILSAPGVILSFAAGSVESNVLTILTMVLLFVGLIATGIMGIILLIRFFFSSFSLLLDHKHGKQALKHSMRLTKNRWWQLFWRITIPKIIFFFAFFTIQLFLLFLLKSVVINVAGLNVLLAARIFTIGSTTIFIVLTAIINPIILIADYLIYKSIP